MLIAVIAAYEEELLLPGCLESLRGRVDRVVVADGRYQLYPGERGPSTDRTVEIAREYGAEVIPSPPAGWEGEHRKRTRLARTGSRGDRYLVIDADERLHGEVPPGGDMRLALFDEFELWHGNRPRVIAHRDRLTYRWHYGVFTRRGVRVPGGTVVPRSECWLEHVPRDRHRRRRDEGYRRLLGPYERELGAP